MSLDIDYSQYPSWQKVSVRGGQTYYIIPGNEGYVYDPFLSAAKGRPVIWQNPQQAQSDADNTREQHEYQNSPVGQAVPVALGTAGTVAGTATVNSLAPAHAVSLIPGGGVLMSDGSIVGGTGAATGGTAAGAGSVTASTAGASGGEAVGGAGFGGGTSGAAGGAGASAAGTEGVAGILGNAGQMGMGPLSAITLSTYLGGKSAYDMLTGNSKSWGDSNTTDKAGRVILGMATGGLSEIARPFTSHESTKDAQARRWGGLSREAQQLYQANHPEDDDGVWDSGKYAGESWTFEKAADRAKDNPNEFRGVYGNMATFGDAWLGYTPDQQRQIVSGLIDANLYKSNKGDIIITDADAAKKIRDNVIGSTEETPAVNEQTPPANQAQALNNEQLGKDLAQVLDDEYKKRRGK